MLRKVVTLSATDGLSDRCRSAQTARFPFINFMQKRAVFPV